jgi:hypothetical protein
MATIENDLKYQFITLREENKKGICFLNMHWFNEYCLRLFKDGLLVPE